MRWRPDGRPLGSERKSLWRLPAFTPGNAYNSYSLPVYHCRKAKRQTVVFNLCCHARNVNGFAVRALIQRICFGQNVFVNEALVKNWSECICPPDFVLF